MDNGNVTHKHNGMLHTCKKKIRKISGTRKNSIGQDHPWLKEETLNVLSHMRFPASNFLCMLLTVSAGCSQQSVNPVLEDTISFSILPVNKHTLDYWRTFKKDTLTHEIKEIISMCM